MGAGADTIGKSTLARDPSGTNDVPNRRAVCALASSPPQAGPGTIAEAMCRGLPTMLSCYLPGQEAGNVDFVEQGGFGQYSNKPKEIAATVAGWMQDDAKLEAIQRAALAAGRPSATSDIAREIGGFLFPAGAALVPAARAGAGSRARQLKEAAAGPGGAAAQPLALAVA